MDNELYQEVLLQHSKHPRNFGPMENVTHFSEGYNAMCGDEISVALKIDDGAVTDARFTGSACVICTASASIMTGEVKGMSCDAAKQLAANFRELAKSGTGSALPMKLQVLGGVHQFPQRVKCAVLPWETLLRALDHPVA